MVRSHRQIAAEGSSEPKIPASLAIKETQTEQKRDRGGEVSVNGEFSISALSDGQIHDLLNKLRSELHKRAHESGDPEEFGLEVLGALNGGDVSRPEVSGGNVVALGGSIKYKASGTGHTCVLYSVNMPGVEPFWAWEDHGTLAYSQSARIGEMRHSVAVHVAVDGMQFIKHTMKHDGEKHKRISEDAWECSWGDNGEGELKIVKSKLTPRNLPVPNH
jgi:hypothetical protein